MPNPLLLDGHSRLRDVLKRVPCGASQWWAGVAEGYHPPATRLGPRTTAWCNADILLLLELLEAMTPLDERAWREERAAFAGRVRARGRTHEAWRSEARALVARLENRVATEGAAA